jgi:hypothetical protein
MSWKNVVIVDGFSRRNLSHTVMLPYLFRFNVSAFPLCSSHCAPSPRLPSPHRLHVHLSHPPHAPLSLCRILVALLLLILSNFLVHRCCRVESTFTATSSSLSALDVVQITVVASLPPLSPESRFYSWNSGIKKYFPRPEELLKEVPMRGAIIFC